MILRLPIGHSTREMLRFVFIFKRMLKLLNAHEYVISTEKKKTLQYVFQKEFSIVMFCTIEMYVFAHAFTAS